VLVLHARHDHTAPVACAARIAERARARRVRILPRSYHLIAADVERDIVAAEVAVFLRNHTSTGALPCAT
jgi:esterase/lipase